MFTKQLATIDKKKEELDALRPLDREQIENLKSLIDVEYTYNSNAIEGNTLTYNETKLVLEKGLTIGGKKLEEHLEIINHKEAIDFIEALAKDNTFLSKKDILDIHYLILKNISTKDAGVFRVRPVGVRKSDGSIYEFIEPLKIEEEMMAFVQWLNDSTDHPIILSAKAHYKLVSIHPFIDGNGRTARLLMNLILIKNGYTITQIKNAKRVEYINAIEEAQESGNSNSFMQIIIDEVEESLDNYLKILTKNIKIN